MIVQSAMLQRPDLPSGKTFIPQGEFLTRASDYGYVEEEWIASGADDKGMPYRTQILVRRPRDPAKFSGTVVVEPLHASGIAAIYMYSAPYIMRSGHGWACIASQKTALDQHVKGSDAKRYASLEIGSDFTPPESTTISPQAGARQITDLKAFLTMLERVNQASAAILAQAGAALRLASGPFGEVGHMVLVGHSQTGWVSTNYITTAHATHRRENGAPIYDGYLPTGMPGAPFGPRDVPLIQVLSDGDIEDAQDRLLDRANPGRHYRRADSDASDDRYRLYELAGVPHLGTRYAPHNDAAFTGERQGGLIKPSDKMNSLPHNELFSACLHLLVAWVVRGQIPPRAERIQMELDGRYFAKDEHGNSIGGVRCAQMDVPHSTYHPVPVNEAGAPVFATVGTEVPFDAAKMRALYGTPGAYLQQFNRRLAELVSTGWFLGEDAEYMRAEAASRKF